MTSAAELERILSDLHTKARENMDILSDEEKEKLLKAFKTVVDRAGAIHEDLKQSVNVTDHEGKVLKMCGQYPRDISGSVMVPTKKDITVAMGSVLQYRTVQAPMTVSVESVTKEENFHYLSAGPTAPNYLFQTTEVYVVMENQEQAGYVIGLCSHGKTIMVGCGYDSRGNEVNGCFQFKSPTQDTHTRATYREIGTLLTNLKKVDDALKELGAVPCPNGGLPILSSQLMDFEQFDMTVADLSKNSEQEKHLYGFLCNYIRVDRKRRQEALKPLVKERLQILLKLSRFDPADFPFVMKRAFQ